MKIRRDKLDRVFSLIIRTRDNWTCTRCGRYYEPPTRALHCSHFWGRRHMGTRWYELNADAHCYGCHMYLGSNPAEFRDWKLQRIGQRNFDMLEYQKNLVHKWSPHELAILYAEMKRRYEELQTGELQRSYA